jgi:glyoxylase-like metal-dependent hydrolase (beta-lactamase superfamily II)
MSQRHRLIVIAALLCLTACSAPTTRELAEEAMTAMGGAESLRQIQTIVMKGEGTRMRIGQTPSAGDEEMPATLKNVTETLDLANGRASLDYEIQAGSFMQHRHEILTRRGEGAESKQVGIEIVGTRPVVATSPGGLFSWGTQNSPEFLLRRNVVSILLAAALSASDSQAAVDIEFNGQMYKFGTARTSAGEDIGLYFDPQSKLLAAFEVNDTETMLGDVPAEYILDEYRAADGIMLPHHIRIRKGGVDYSEIKYASVVVNDPSANQVFNVPQSASGEADRAIAAADYTPLRLNRVANGVYHAQAYSHHSMVVEFPNWVAVVEAPYTETQSKVLTRLIEQQFPGKPIQFVAVTHHHYDHTGGVRGMAATGATILVEKGHESALRQILDAPHSNPQDELDKRRNAQPPQKTGSMEVYEGTKVMTSGPQSLELYAIQGSAHAEPMVLAYVPSARVLFQSDLFFPGTGAATPYTEHLLASIRELNLRVDTMVGGHGGVGPFAELVRVARAGARPTSD